MQCRSALQRSRCPSRHAFNPALALWSTFSTSVGSPQVRGKAEARDPKSAQRHFGSSTEPAQLQDENQRSHRSILPKSLSATWGLHKSIDGNNTSDGKMPDQANAPEESFMSETRKMREQKESEDYWQMAADTGYRLETHTEHGVAEQSGMDDPVEAEEGSRIDYVEEEEGSSEFLGPGISPRDNSKILTGEDILAHAPDASRPTDQQASDWKAKMAVIRDRAQMARNRVLSEAPAELQDLRDLLNYNADVIQPEQPLVAEHVPAPWTVHRFHKLVYNYPAKNLAREIGVFATYCEPTEFEKRARQAISKQLIAYFRNALEADGYQLNVYGSEKTGLAFSTSDIDFRLSKTVHTYGKKEWHPDSLNSAMDFVFRLLENSTEHTNVVIRRNGRFPLVSAQHIKSGIDIQITASFPTNRQQALIQQYLEEIPNLRALYYLIRTALSVRGLIDVYNGGLGSYGTMMLLIAALTRRGTNPVPDYVPSDITQRHSAYQLLRILNTLSPENFNPVTDGLTLLPKAKKFRKHDWSGHDRVTLANGEPARQAVQEASFVKLALKRKDGVRAGQWYSGATKPLQPYLLCLQDPANPRNNDLGIRTHAIKHILATLNDLRIGLERDLKALEENMTANEKEGGNRMTLINQWMSQEKSMIGPFVGRCHELFAERRAKIEAYGSTCEMLAEGLNIRGIVSSKVSEAAQKHEDAWRARMNKEMDGEGERGKKGGQEANWRSLPYYTNTVARSGNKRLRRYVSHAGGTDNGLKEGQEARVGTQDPSDRPSPPNVIHFENRVYDIGSASPPRSQTTVEPSLKPSEKPLGNTGPSFKRLPINPEAEKKKEAPAASEAYPTFDPEAKDDSSKHVSSGKTFSSIEIPQWVRENSTIESAPTNRGSTTGPFRGQTFARKDLSGSSQFRIRKHDAADDESKITFPQPLTARKADGGSLESSGR